MFSQLPGLPLDMQRFCGGGLLQPYRFITASSYAPMASTLKPDRSFEKHAMSLRIRTSQELVSIISELVGTSRMHFAACGITASSGACITTQLEP